MRITSKRISKAIEAATGDKGIGVHVSYGKHYAHFYCDDESPLDRVKGEKLVHGINALSELTIERWVSEYERVIDDKY